MKIYSYYDGPIIPSGKTAEELQKEIDELHKIEAKQEEWHLLIEEVYKKFNSLAEASKIYATLEIEQQIIKEKY